jgi:hypothetical protein
MFMIKVNYLGRFGNNLFQYCFGKIIQDITKDEELEYDSIEGFLKESKISHASFIPDLILTGHKVGIDINNLAQQNILLDGFFQRYEYYKQYKSKIKNEWLKINPFNVGAKKNDLAMHIRRGDYVKLGFCLPESFYDSFLDQNYDRIFIFTDEPNDPFIKKMAKKSSKIIVQSNSLLVDFKSLMSFNNIVLSQSSFSWWSAFLSKAENIYLPIVKNSIWDENVSGANLIVDDESRYQKFLLMNSYKLTLSDFIFYKKKQIKKSFPF